MISGRIENKNAENRIIKLLNDRQRNIDFELAKRILALNTLIRVKLSETLGEKAKHFDVKINPISHGVEIIVVANDDIGTFIYRGTSAHDIVSSSEPMPMPDGGFTRSVRHPGTKSMKAQIDEAIHYAIMDSRFF